MGLVLPPRKQEAQFRRCQHATPNLLHPIKERFGFSLKFRERLVRRNLCRLSETVAQVREFTGRNAIFFDMGRGAGCAVGRRYHGRLLPSPPSPSAAIIVAFRSVIAPRTRILLCINTGKPLPPFQEPHRLALLRHQPGVCRCYGCTSSVLSAVLAALTLQRLCLVHGRQGGFEFVARRLKALALHRCSICETRGVMVAL
jgi:hypothetical protein